jgi:hypothetical protein
MSAMYECPRWQKCGANLCPLDPEWQRRTHGAGDTVCFYLLEAVKPGSEERFKGCPTEGFRDAVLRPLADMSARWSAVRRAVERAKVTGSRMDRLPPKREAA